MEIECKFLVKRLPENYRSYPFHQIEQGYLCTEPVVRVRREDDTFYLTYKSKGLLAREEYNLPLSGEAYEHLIAKTDGYVLTKKRFLIPLGKYRNLTAELDVFEGVYEGLALVEVEFESEEDAARFAPPDWFGEDVTFSGEFQNSKLAMGDGRAPDKAGFPGGVCGKNP